MQSPSQALEGILLIDKARNLTSHDIVDCVRRKLKMKRVGHAGTLDPMATGLLIILVGKATKASQYLVNLDKSYEGTLKLGVSTDTHDSEGRVMDTLPVPDLSESQLRDVMATFLGDQQQVPPMFSAKKVKGKPLYKLARQGKTIEREPRLIHIYEFVLTHLALPFASFRLACSKGSYVRTLVHDLGEKIACGAHLTELRRTVIEHLSVEQAIPLERFETMSYADVCQCLIPVSQAVPSKSL